MGRAVRSVWEGAIGVGLSRRLRFEVLRRDRHRCRYCGREAAATALHVGHVVPEALGGRSEPTNLATSCKDCNTGKSSIAADSPIIDDVAADAIRWAKAMAVALEETRETRKAIKTACATFDSDWLRWTCNDVQIPKADDWVRSIETFLRAGLTVDDLHDMIPIAMHRTSSDAWAYFCGIAWNTIRDAENRSMELLHG